MTLAEMRKKYADLLESHKSLNRSLTAAETAEMDTLKAEIARLEAEAKAGVEKAEQERSAAAARMSGPDRTAMPSNEYFRSIAKGEADVGNKEVVADVVRQYNESSPIFAAHKNVQKRSTGNSYGYTQITKGGAGYAKTEGNAGTEDSDSKAEVIAQKFKTYSSQKITVTQESLDDFAADISNEIMTLGMAKSVLAFGDDCVAALKSAYPTSPTVSTFKPTETAGTSWALSDLVAAYYEIPVRNRTNVKFTCNSKTAQALVSLLTVETSPQAAVIGLSAGNIVEDDAMPDDVVFVGDITRVLAIGMKTPVRTLVLQVSEGTTYEVQPRLAVGLRDATALSVRKLKAAAQGG